jgi:hypothetical protein
MAEKKKHFIISDYQGRSGWSEERLDFLLCSLGAAFKHGKQEFQICMGSVSHDRTATQSACVVNMPDKSLCHANMAALL